MKTKQFCVHYSADELERASERNTILSAFQKTSEIFNI